MKYFLIGSCVVIGLILLAVIIKAFKKRQEEKYLEDYVVWQLSKAREMGIPLDNIKFDDSNSLLDPNTGKPIIY
jgi:hypothetical protein